MSSPSNNSRSKSAHRPAQPESYAAPGFPPASIQTYLAAQREQFLRQHPQSVRLAAQAQAHFLYGVPMHWMSDWPMPVSLFVASAQAAGFRCVDGHDHLDFCLGDTGAMFGHSPPAVARVLAQHGAQGLTTMLPHEQVPALGEALADRFGLPVWQLCATASDANRFVIRWARAVTGRPAIAVFNGCYHGTVDDVFVDLVAGEPVTRPSLLGQVHDLTQHTRVVEFNDLPALERALADGQVACVITEPVLTNIGMVLPEPGFLEGVRALTRRHGTLLVIDETHTLSSGPAGYARAHGLEADVLVVGKPIAGGTPGAVYGFTAELARCMERVKAAAPPGHSGIGTTLSAGMLTVQLMHAMLTEVMTPQAYERMFEVCERAANGLSEVIDRHRLPWSVTRIGARCEVQFSARQPRNGSQAMAAMDPALEAALHLGLLNKGVLLTPFHNMILSSPAHGLADADQLVQAFDAVLDELGCAA